jgi:hypothetical protein
LRSPKSFLGEATQPIIVHFGRMTLASTAPQTMPPLSLKTAVFSNRPCAIETTPLARGAPMPSG